MSWTETFRTAVDAVRAHRMRSLLTMLGILIGTAAVILLVAVGTGISNLVQHQIETLGSNAVDAFYVTTGTGAPLPSQDAASTAKVLEDTLRA